MQADVELKQMWNFKNQETNDKRQRQMMGDELVQRLADKNRCPWKCKQVKGAATVFDDFAWSTSPTSCLKDIKKAEDVLFS